jgi:hypothetical protein
VKHSATAASACAASERRRAALVGDHPDKLTLAPETQRGLHEIVAIGADHPGRAHDRMAATLRPDSCLALSLGPAIDICRIDRGIFTSGPLSISREDIVGRDLNDRYPGLGCRSGQLARSHRIDGLGQPGFGFRLVDRPRN